MDEKLLQNLSDKLAEKAIKLLDKNPSSSNDVALVQCAVQVACALIEMENIKRLFQG